MIKRKHAYYVAAVLTLAVLALMTGRNSQSIPQVTEEYQIRSYATNKSFEYLSRIRDDASLSDSERQKLEDTRLIYSYISIINRNIPWYVTYWSEISYQEVSSNDDLKKLRKNLIHHFKPMVEGFESVAKNPSKLELNNYIKTLRGDKKTIPTALRMVENAKGKIEDKHYRIIKSGLEGLEDKIHDMFLD